MKLFAVPAIHAIVHAGVCCLFVVANDLWLMLHKHIFGEATSRGYMPGSVTRLAFLVFLIANIAIALAPWKTLKIGIALATTAFLSLFLLPEHPLRALFYALLTGALSAIAIVLAARIAQAMEARDSKARESK